MNRNLVCLLTVCGLCMSTYAAAFPISGTVYADNDDNGVFSVGDAPVPGAIIYWETTVTALTDAQGQFSLEVPGTGIVWVRTPSGFEPSPTWRAVSAASTTVDLGLKPAAPAPPVRFVHASDTHRLSASVYRQWREHRQRTRNSVSV